MHHLVANPTNHPGQGLVETCGIAASGLCHVGTTAASATNLRGDKIRQRACLQAIGAVGADARDQAHLPVVTADGSDYHGRTAEFLFELIDGAAEALRVGVVETRGQHLDAVDFHRLAGQVVATGAGDA